MRYIRASLIRVALVVWLSVPESVLSQSGAKVEGKEPTETTFKIGPRIGVPLGDMSDVGTLFFGADARIGTAIPVVFSPSIDLYLGTGSLTVLTVDLNAFYEFGAGNGRFVPYVGGGVAVTRTSGEPAIGKEADTGINLVGGARMRAGPVEPFIQVNTAIDSAISGDTRLGLAGGSSSVSNFLFLSLPKTTPLSLLR
ncbi:hypothetical protein BSZ35_18280 [Salinibacter sp. 10B]|uniref:hypothetical protein n=1 Tax=Salinibacter sp. 10B TaxID=1923971 RepID=UPI000CF52629|nr:hypothetical protein [Salinibacter sp. 10B]PQJ26877.1 hypothetical protein BSZ35_18280 [Salinibacter sp. 10B]